MPPASTGPYKPGDRILDKWEVRGLLGRGGHAFVYDCFNAFLNQEVAIKVIPNSPLRGHQLFNRARGEAQFLYKANHPNVVRVMDAGEIDGMAYIVMEKLDGMNLRQMLRELGPLTVVEALCIALPIAEALQAAHAMGVIHRDLKPENIFLLAANEVKVLDFGIAKFLEGGGYQTTQKDLIQGTAPYMSPEQAQAHGVTYASDTFQLGTIIYEMIAGICPVMVGLEEVPSQTVILALQILKPPPRLKSVVRGVPDYVDRLVWRAIAKEPQQRFREMRDFAQEIRRALKTLFTELPEKSLRRRVLLPRQKAQRRPPANGSRAEARVVSTAPIDLAASTGVLPPHADGPPSSRAMLAARPAPKATAQVAISRPISPQQNDRNAARRIVLRAVIIGTAAALPFGIVGGLRVRSHSATPAPDVTAAPGAQETHLPPSLANSAAFGQVASTPMPVASGSPNVSAPAPADAQAALIPIQQRPDPVTARAAAAPAAPAALAPRRLRPAMPSLAGSPPLPSAASESKAAKPEDSAKQPSPLRPLIF